MANGRKRGRSSEDGEIINLSSSDSDDDRHARERRRSGKSKIDSSLERQSLIKPVELALFQKICLRRSEICKFFEHPDYQVGVKGAFVRISYAGAYNIGQIKEFKVGKELYKVE